MKKLNKSLIALGLGLGFSVIAAQSAFAAGTVNFTGRVIAEGCTINSESKVLDVLLGDVSAKELTTAGELAGGEQFVIELENCTPDTTVAVRFTGANDDNDADILAVTPGNGAATNVGIALFEEDGTTQVNLDQDSARITLPTGATELSLPYVARYKATGQATPGPANGTVAYSLQYQ